MAFLLLLIRTFIIGGCVFTRSLGGTSSGRSTVSAFVPSQSQLRHHRKVSLFAAKKGANKKKNKANNKKPAAGGGFGARAVTKEEDVYQKAIRAKTKEVQSTPSNPRSWLELGSVLVKLGDYAEAEEVFRMGNIAAPGDEMLGGAYTAIAGHSAKYFGGALPEDRSVMDASKCPFDTYEVNQPAEDFRTVSWTARSDKPRIQVSKGPLLPKEECAKAIDSDR